MEEIGLRLRINIDMYLTPTITDFIDDIHTVIRYDHVAYHESSEVHRTVRRKS